VTRSTAWTTPADVVRQLTTMWERGTILAAQLGETPLFPFTVRFKKPETQALTDRFDDVRKWIKALEEDSKPRRGFGYDIQWTEIHHRQLGRNRFPMGIQIPTEDDALRLIGKQRQAERFQHVVTATMRDYPVLRAWLAKRPMTALEHADDWERILAILTWFRDHPRTGLYLRQLDIPQVDTKFIEARKGLLAELLDLILPETSIEPRFTGARAFEPRYGLRSKPPLVRFRVLDPRLYLQGLSDLTVPVPEFAKLSIPVKRVFMTENDINGLAFPEVPDSLVIFGLGYSLDCLAEIPWLSTTPLFYWGDIDTHGFAMLARLRRAFPHTHSFLMDRDTLLAHGELWGREEDPYQGTLDALTPSEQSLFEDLTHHRLGDRVRLEQERIAFNHVERAVLTPAQASRNVMA
jgi:hypothetical protein